MIYTEKGQGNCHFSKILSQVRIIRDKQGGRSNRTITTREDTVTADGGNTNLRHYYSHKSPQYQALQGRVSPYKHQNRYRIKQQIWEEKNFEVNTTSKFYFCLLSLFFINKPTGVYATPRSEKGLQNIIEHHKICVNINLLPL